MAPPNLSTSPYSETDGQEAEGEGEGTGTVGVGGHRARSDPDGRALKYPHLVGTQGGLTALLFASRQGYTDTAETLVKAGADVNEVDPGDHTSPLMMAIVNGHFDLAEKLLAAGADTISPRSAGCPTVCGAEL